MLCFKDKESDENVLVFYKSEASDESTSLCLRVIRYLFLWNVKFMTMKVIIFYEKKFMKKSFVIL